jgi:hypothetical protein
MPHRSPNHSGLQAPLREIRSVLVNELKMRGIDVLDQDVLDPFMARHRLRDTSGVDEETTVQFAKETAARGVLITTLEAYQKFAPFKVALTCRLVSVGETPSILWMDGAGVRGDDHPGLFDVGMVRNMEKLRERAIGEVADSLEKYYADNALPTPQVVGKYGPKTYYRDPGFPSESPLVVAILPFLNRSGVKYGSDILQEHLLKGLFLNRDIRVLEPGAIRQTMFKFHMVMPAGMSRSDAELILSDIPHADLLITGIVEDYNDPLGTGVPSVDFYLVATDRTGKVVWRSRSFNRGDEGVWFFDLGSVKSAYPMTDMMVQTAVAGMLNPAMSKKR